MGHQKEGGKERKVPEYHFDYCFPGDELGFKWTILVGKERISKTWMATAVPNKGASGRFATDKCLEFMEENGDGDNNVIVKKKTKNLAWSICSKISETRDLKEEQYRRNHQ